MIPLDSSKRSLWLNLAAWYLIINAGAIFFVVFDSQSLGASLIAYLLVGLATLTLIAGISILMRSKFRALLYVPSFFLNCVVIGSTKVVWNLQPVGGVYFFVAERSGDIHAGFSESFGMPSIAIGGASSFYVAVNYVAVAFLIVCLNHTLQARAKLRGEISNGERDETQQKDGT